MRFDLINKLYIIVTGIVSTPLYYISNILTQINKHFQNLCLFPIKVCSGDRLFQTILVFF